MSQNSEHVDGGSSSEEEEIFGEEIIASVEKSGVLERKKEGEKKTKFYWYLLLGGTLFEYRSIKQKEPKEIFNLKGCEIIPVTEPISTAFEVRKGGKTVLLLLPQSMETRDSWVSSLRKNLELEPTQPPKRDVAKKGTLRMRMKKTLAGKVAISSPGKFIAKSSVPEEVMHLVDALRHLMVAYIGEQEALEVEDDIIKLYVKCFCLEEDGQITMEDFFIVDQPIRRAFAAISKLRDETVSRKIHTNQAIDQLIGTIRESLTDAETKLTELLTPHLKPHTISKIPTIFKFIANPKFLRKAIVAPFPGETPTTPFLEDEIDTLCRAIDRYLSISVYKDD